MDGLGTVGFFFSLLFLVWTSLKLSSLFGDWQDRFWIAVLAGYLQLTASMLVLSVFQLMTWQWVLLLQGVLAGGLLIRTGPRVDVPRRSSLPEFGELDRLAQVLLTFVVTLVVLSFVTRFFLPLWHRDGLRYIAPRALYWMQQSGLGPYPTMEYRQIILAFGTDIVFMWGVMFTRLELAGRLVYWLGLPLSTVGLYTVLSSLRFDRTFRLLGAALFLTIPILLRFGTYLQPVQWVILFGLGVGYWTAKSPTRRTAALMGAFTALAVTSKQPALALTSGCLLVLGIRAHVGHASWKQILTYLGSFLVVVLLSGYFLRYYLTYYHYGAFVRGDTQSGLLATAAPYVWYTHTVRLVFMLMEFPIPVSLIRQPLVEAGDSLLALLGAAQLPYEAAEGRSFGYTPPRWPHNGFGLLGLLVFWFVTWFVTRLGNPRELLANSRAILRDSRVQYGLVAASLFFGPLYVLKWSLAPSSVETYLAPGLVLSIPIILASLRSLRRRERLWTLFVTALLVYLVAFSVFSVNRAGDKAAETGFSPDAIGQASAEDCAPSLIDEHVPADGTVFLLIERRVITYFAFGDDYRRQVVEVERVVGPDELNDIQRDHPSAYLYVTSGREQLDQYEGERSVLNATDSVRFVNSRTENCLGGTQSWLYRFE